MMRIKMFSMTKSIQGLSLFFLVFCWGNLSFGSGIGVWDIQGQHSVRGPYKGQMQVLEKEVIRLIEYDNFSYRGHKVQEIWTGQKKLEDSGRIVFSFSLKAAEFIRRLRTKVRLQVEFDHPVLVEIETATDLTQEPRQWKFSDGKDGVFQEVLSWRSPNSLPLWKSLRQKFPALHKTTNLNPLIDLVVWIAKKREDFFKHPLVKRSKNRPEFLNKEHSIIQDLTDRDFYLSEEGQSVLRIANKFPDEIGLEESFFRKSAYSKKLSEKARFFEDRTQRENINSLGMVVHQRYAPGGVLIGSYHDGDSLLWTGIYAYTQALRHIDERGSLEDRSQGLANFKKSFKGILTSVLIHPESNQFARTLEILSPGEAPKSDFIAGTGEYAGIQYMPGGNNDMFKGIALAMAIGQRILPLEDELRPKMRAVAQKLLELSVIEKKTFNEVAAKGLAALVLGDEKLAQEYREVHPFSSFTMDRLKYFFSGFGINTVFNVKGNADWSGLNLHVVSQITQIEITNLLGGMQKYENQWRERVMDTWCEFSEVRHTLIAAAATHFAYNKGITGDVFRRERRNRDEFEAKALNSLVTLMEYPMQRNTPDLEYNWSLNPEFVASPVPRLFWKTFSKGEKELNYFINSISIYPMFESSGLVSNFVWKDHFFDFEGYSSEDRGHPAVDYLFAYHLAKNAGLIDQAGE